MNDCIVHFFQDRLAVVDVINRKVKCFDIGAIGRHERNRFFDVIGGFLQDNPSRSKSFKAFAFTFADFQYVNSMDAYVFFRKCLDFCKTRNMFCYFSNYHTSDVFAIMNQMKYHIEIGQNILILSFNTSESTPLGFVVERTSDCYQVVDVIVPKSVPFSADWKNEVLHFKPVKIFVQYGSHHDQVSVNHLRKSLYGCGPMEMYEIKDYDQHMFTTTLDKCLHLMGEKINPFNVADMVIGTFELKAGNESLFMTSALMKVPFEKVFIIDCSLEPLILRYSYSNGTKIDFVGDWKPLKAVTLSKFKSKKVKVTLKLDINSLYDFNVEEYDNIVVPNVESDCEKENVKSESNISIVFSKYDFCLHLGTTQNTITDGEGIIKTPIYISFAENVPVVGEAAKKVLIEKPEFVVFDLMKLCSLYPDEEIISDPSWKFKIEKVADEIFVFMETFRGPRKSTVPFLLAIVLKVAKLDAMKVLGYDSGNDFEKLEIKFEDDITVTETLKANFVKAGKIIGVAIDFV